MTSDRIRLCSTIALAAVALQVGVARSQSLSRELHEVLGRTANVAQGAKLYETCAACHGARGEGVADGTVPAIAAQPLTVLAKQLIDFRTGARNDPRMQHFASSQHLSYSQEIADVAAYVSSLPARSVSPTADPKGERGAVLYIRKCERCHGSMAEGNESELTPRLAGQQADYLVRQLSYDESVRPALKKAHAGIGPLSDADIAALATTLSGF